MHSQEYILGCELNPFKLTVYISLLIMGHSYSGEVFVTQESSLGFLKPYRNMTICFAPGLGGSCLPRSLNLHYTKILYSTQKIDLLI